MFLARYPSEQFKTKELARRLGFRTEKEYTEFKHALRRLQDANQIQRMKGKKLRHLHVEERVRGKLSMSKQGFGIVTVEQGGEEIFIGQNCLGDAGHDDVVDVLLLPQSTKKRERGARREGEVVEVVDRGNRTIVGTVRHYRKTLFVEPDDTRIARSVAIRKEHLHGAVEGDKVVVEFAGAGRHENPEGKILEVLGRAGTIHAELLSVLREFNLPMAFPSDVVAESQAMSSIVPEEEIRRRFDLRDEACFTIDPDDAKDFDDAVSLAKLENGNYRLGVHIADVSHYVREGTSLDKEALKRGTSVYIPNGVIPMLPEHLSNNICSLRPLEDRLTFSVLMEVTPRGAVKDHQIRETVIRSKRRFTYEEVESILGGSTTILDSVSEWMAPILREMHALSSVLTKKRMREGSIDFESAEAKFRFDSDGNPVEIIKKVRLDSHRLVEEFMLLANKVVAQHIGLPKKEEHPKPFLYRVHDLPDEDRIRELAMFVEKFGHKLRIDGGVSSKALQKLLSDVHGTEVENVINEVALRTMAKAVYSERNIGHFGLAFDYYTHFTSPIRRYPDLMIHRLLKKYAGEISLAEREHIRQRLPYIAKQSSDTERTAMEAERAAVKVMQVEYMKRHLGDEFHGVVSGVIRYGMFVEINDLLAEGMVHVRDLADDYYDYDEKHFALVGRRTQRRYRLGDPVTVKVVRVNPEERQIDFVVVGEERDQRKSRR